MRTMTSEILSAPMSKRASWADLKGEIQLALARLGLS
jgi:hypothetical protein